MQEISPENPLTLERNHQKHRNDFTQLWRQGPCYSQNPSNFIRIWPISKYYLVEVAARLEDRKGHLGVSLWRYLDK